MSSMLSLDIMAGMIPGMGLALGLLPLLLVWTVSGFRYAALMEGISLLTQIPSMIANLVMGSSATQVAVKTIQNPDWLTSYLLTLPLWELWTLFIGLLLGTFAYTIFTFWWVARTLRNIKRFRPVLVRLGAVEP